MNELHQSRHGPVAVLTLNRPQQGNKLTTALAVEVASVLRMLGEDDSVGACVLTGAGDLFCLGGDYVGAGPTESGRIEYANALLVLDESMTKLGKPLFAAVNGDAHAGGQPVLGPLADAARPRAYDADDLARS